MSIDVTLPPCRILGCRCTHEQPCDHGWIDAPPYTLHDMPRPLDDGELPLHNDHTHRWRTASGQPLDERRREHVSALIQYPRARRCPTCASHLPIT